MYGPTQNATFPDELDIARYIDIVRRHWRMILLCGVLAAAAAFAWATLQPKQYIGQAYIAILRTDTIVSFNSNIRTVSDTDPNGLSPEELARRQSIRLLGMDQALALQVIKNLGARLPDSLQQPEMLVNRITVANSGDLLIVQATANAPDLVAEIANEWSIAYADRLNRVYGATQESADVIETQVAQSRREYDSRQSAVIAYMQNSSIELLKRQQAAVVLQLDKQVQLENKLSQLQSDVSALRSRLQGAGTAVSTADELTQILIQASAFNNGGDSSAVRMDISLSASVGATAQEQMQQLDALSKAIEQRRSAMPPAQKQELYQELNRIQSELETAQQELKQLQAARELAWNTLQSVNTKAAEIRVASGAKNQVVQIAAAAVAPTAPVSSRSLIYAVIFSVIGLVIGFFLALVWDVSSARMRVLKPARQ